MTRLIILLLFFILIDKNGIAQNIDTVEINFENETLNILKFNNIGVYYFEDSLEISPSIFGNKFIRELGVNTFLVNDSGRHINADYSYLCKSNSRLYRQIECDSGRNDTIGCYIFTNKICGLFDTLYQSDFLGFLEDSGVSNTLIESNYFKIELPLGRDILEFSFLISNNEYVIHSGLENLYKGYLGTGTDPYFSNQYYLKNNIPNQYDINVEPAWIITKGKSSISIGILDNGVSNEHPDLNPSKLIIMNNSNFSTLSNNFEYNNNNGSTYPKYWVYDLILYPWDDPNKPIPNKYLRSIHGTSMAGIIGAEHNDIGIKGIAPNCKILPIKASIDRSNVVSRWPYLNDSYLLSIFQPINKDKWPLDVLNCSWYADQFYTVGYNIPQWFEELQILIKTGRNGRGTAVVACTGNERKSNNCGKANFYPSGIKINGIVSVGACNKYGLLTNYSICGDGIDLVGIANDIDNNGYYLGQDIFSLDLPGSDGYNPTNITEMFTSIGWLKSWNNQSNPNSSFGSDYSNYIGFGGGTSSATAQVTGAVALLLSENPCLKSTEIEVILKRNAKKINSNIYNYNTKSTEPGWSKELGYGLLDIYQSLIDPLWDQNVNYTNEYGLKGGTIYVGDHVTTALPNGNVIIGGGGNVTYLAFRTIEIYEGFEVSNNGEFLAEIYQPDFPSCMNWDKVEIPILGEVYGEIVSDFLTKNNHTPISNNLKYLSESTEIIKENIKSSSTDNHFDFEVYPNPNFGDKIKISFSIPVVNPVIEIRDMIGKQIFKLESKMEANYFEFEPNGVKSGVYIIFINVDGFQLFKKIILI
jgi:subtilisin family serine protease